MDQGSSLIPVPSATPRRPRQRLVKPRHTVPPPLPLAFRSCFLTRDIIRAFQLGRHLSGALIVWSDARSHLSQYVRQPLCIPTLYCYFVISHTHTHAHTHTPSRRHTCHQLPPLGPSQIHVAHTHRETHKYTYTPSHTHTHTLAIHSHPLPPGGIIGSWQRIKTGFSPSYPDLHSSIAEQA